MCCFAIGMPEVSLGATGFAPLFLSSRAVDASSRNVRLCSNALSICIRVILLLNHHIFQFLHCIIHRCRLDHGHPRKLNSFYVSDVITLLLS